MMLFLLPTIVLKTPCLIQELFMKYIWNDTFKYFEDLKLSLIYSITHSVYQSVSILRE